MHFKSLNQFRSLRTKIVRLRSSWLRVRQGVDLDPSVSLSLTSRFVSGQRGSITVGAQTLIAFKTLLISRDTFARLDRPIHIGRHCFIGGGSTVLPGVSIGDECIVAAGALVDQDVPARSIVAGNPARVIASGISVGPYGRLSGADENTRRMWK